MRWPLDSFIQTQGYSATHPAYDLANFQGYPIRAPEDGRIAQVQNDPTAYFGGRFITMIGASGYRHYMGHTLQNLVQVGQTVGEGQQIAEIGMSGFAIPSQGISAPSGPHTHHEVSKNGQTVDFKTLLTPIGGDMSEVGEVEFHDLYIAFFGPMSLNPPSDNDRKRWIGEETNTVIRQMQEDPRYYSYNKYVADLEHAQGGDSYDPVTEQLYRKKG